MKIAIFGQVLARENVEHILELLHWLQSRNVHVVIYEPYFMYVVETHKIAVQLASYGTFTELSNDVDCVISIGGDGTMLSSISIIKDSGVPVVGLNIGRLGFLSSIPKEQIEEALNEIIHRKYRIEPRTLISATTNIESPWGEKNYALNEITILKKDSSSMITIHSTLNGEFFNSYWADGLIISTPTGSTGYSLSCGGPIILPEAQNFALTPIAPHNLSVRPVIIPDDIEITLQVESRNKTFLLSIDSQSYSIKKSARIALKKTPFTINLIQLHTQSFTQTLRNKLLWGFDKRNLE